MILQNYLAKSGISKSNYKYREWSAVENSRMTELPTVIIQEQCMREDEDD